MKRLLTIVFAATLFLGLPLVAMGEIIHWPTEVTYYDATKAYVGVTVFATQQAPSSNSWIYMIDMDGRLVHKLKTPISVSPFPFLLENGSFLISGSYQGQSTKYLMELNWDGSIAKSLTIASAIHHDYKKFWNKKLNAYTYMFVSRTTTGTAAQATALGAIGTTVTWDADGIVEIDMNGNVVWQWNMADHLCQNTDPAKPNYYADVAGAPGRLDINVHWIPAGGNGGAVPSAIPGADWTHYNSFDYNSDLGLVVMNSRNMNEFWVVDHDNTFVSTTDWSANLAAAASSAGDFKYRFGCPSNYNQGGMPVYGDNVSTQIYGQHNIQFIQPTAWPAAPDGSYAAGPALPGSGDLLLFDNHASNNNPLGSYSRMLEVNPYVSGKSGTSFTLSGAYVNPPLAGYTRQPGSSGVGFSNENVSNQITWMFKPAMGNGFLSSHISGVQRLPNGNTLGCSGEQGHFLEVTSTGAIAWEYSNPIDATTGIAYKFQQNSTQGSNYQVFRAYRYPVTHPGLVKRVQLYSNGQILPIALGETGVGFTLTGQAPCRNAPCVYGSGTSSGSSKASF